MSVLARGPELSAAGEKFESRGISLRVNSGTFRGWAGRRWKDLLSATRPTVGAMAVRRGHGPPTRYALDYACQREAIWSPRSVSFQAVAFKMADMKSRIGRGSSGWCGRAGWMARNNQSFDSAEGRLAKLVASETAVYVT